MKRTLLFIPILIVLALCSRVIASDNETLTYDNIHELYNYYHTKAPHSCEAIYYGLFTDGTNRKDYFVTPSGKDWVSESWSQSYDHFSSENSGTNLESKIQERKEKDLGLFAQAKEFFKNVVLNQESFRENHDIVQEWSKRLDRAVFQILDPDIKSSGAYMDVYNMTTHGYEKVVDQLDSATTLESKDLFYEKIPVYTESMGPPTLGWSHNLFFGISSPSAIMFLMGHELSHLIDWAPSLLVHILAHKRSYGAREVSPSLFSNFSIEDMGQELGEGFFGNPDKEGIEDLPKMGIDNGRGTDLYDPFKKLLEDANFEGASEYLRQLEKAKRLPEQMTEAAADVFATLLVSSFIEQTYKTVEERKQAALSVLFSWAPHLYSKEAQKIMNEVSSKKTNEERVFRIILAHKKFRDFIGCEFYNENVPIDFSIINKPIRIGDPNGDGKVDDADLDIMYAFHWRYLDLFLEEAISLDLDKDQDIDMDDARILIQLSNQKSIPSEEVLVSQADFLDRIPTKFKRQSVIVHRSTQNALNALILEGEEFYTSHIASIETVSQYDIENFVSLVKNAEYAVEGASRLVYEEALSEQLLEENVSENDKKYEQVFKVSAKVYKTFLARLISLNEKSQRMLYKLKKS